MIAFRLWRALFMPPLEHPLFRRAQAQREAERKPAFALPLWGWIALGGIGCALVGAIPDFYGVICYAAAIIVPFGVLLYATVVGMGVTLRVADAIADERANQMLDLLAVTPDGLFAALWALASATQALRHPYSGRPMRRVWSVRSGLLTTTLFVAPLMTGSYVARFPFILPAEPLNCSLLFLIVILLLIALAFYVDDVYSLADANLIGLLVPLIVRSRAEARAWALISFLLLQGCAYGLMWLGAFLIVPSLSARLNIAPVLELIAFPFVLLGMFVGIRAAIAVALARALSARLHLDAAEFRLVLSGAA